ncbi:hypothetical protein D3C85_1517960 [compost metagenome]
MDAIADLEFDVTARALGIDPLVGVELGGDSGEDAGPAGIGGVARIGRIGHRGLLGWVGLGSQISA